MKTIIARSYEIIEEWIEPSSRVLDLGCGDGALLKRLKETRYVSGIGIEISQESIVQCLKNDICVYQADIDKGLSDIEDNSFDYVILNDTLQVIMHPHSVVSEMLRVGKTAIVSISNFGYFINRLNVLLSGRMYKNIRFSRSWYNSPVIRFVSLNEFSSFLERIGVEIVDSKFFLSNSLTVDKSFPFKTLLAKEALFRLRRI